ncbi:MAG TPA: hypothetical protein PK413_01105 [Thermoanaerobaculia bacterium]|nr:hypothetical protein [Thermoanaerobaculia bacterium]
MGSMIFRSGTKLFASASIGMILIFFLHTWAHFNPLSPNKADSRLGAVFQAMRDYLFELGPGPKPSVLDFFQGMSLSMGLFFAYVGCGNLIVLAVAGDVPGLIPRLALANALFLGSIIGVMFYFKLAPVVMSTVEILFLLAFFLNRGGRPQP